MDCRNVEPAECERLERKARAYLRRWRTVRDFEDLLGAVRLQFWTAMHRHGERYWPERDKILTIVCRQVAHRWAWKKENLWRTQGGENGGPLPEMVSAPADEDLWELLFCPYGSDRWLKWATPDPAPQVIHRLWCRQLREVCFATLDEEERAFVWRAVQEGHEFGVADQKSYNRFHKLLNRTREEMGLSPRIAMGYARKPNTPWKKVVPARPLRPSQDRERMNQMKRARYARNKDRERARALDEYHRRGKERRRKRKGWERGD